MRRLKKLLGASWRPRVVLAVGALIVLAAAVGLRVGELETSSTTETTQPSAQARATPTVPGLSAPSSPSPASVKTTTVRSSGSDALELGLLGVATVLALMAIFFDRLSEIGGPGFSLKLAPAAADAVARRARARAQQLTSSVRDRGLNWDELLRQPSMVRLNVMAKSYQLEDPSAPLDATREAVAEGGHATLKATEYAQALLRLAQKSPESLRAVAEAWGIPEEEWLPVLNGTISTALWDRLADRALSAVGLPEPDGALDR